MDVMQKARTRILFFAWGDSIHARRRIGIFDADPTFDVGVVSTFAYKFENARHFHLLGADKETDETSEKRSRWLRFCRALLAAPLYLALRCVDNQASFPEARRVVEDIFRIRKYVREFKPDLIFLQTLIYPNYLSLLLPRRIPSMITFWNGDVTWWAKWTGIERVFKKQIVIRGVRRASAITVNSDVALAACLAYGAPRKKLHLIRYPGVDLDAFKPVIDKAAIRSRLGITHSKIVLCPRGLGGYLNSDVIIESVARVAAEIPDVLFLFLSGVGSQEIWQSHLKRSAELGVTSNVKLAGQVSWQEMPAYYQVADVMVSISSNDSLPNCMLEAMACGVPVIMGDIPQIREWVNETENGFLVPPREAGVLATAILKALEAESLLVPSFIRYNLNLVQLEVDSKKVAVAVKDLVRKVASENSGHIRSQPAL